MERASTGERLTNAGVVLNVFEAVDVIALIKGGVYDDLSLTVGDALLKLRCM
jgi:5'-AMP-activated protein kinase regulatory gamma subunit